MGGEGEEVDAEVANVHLDMGDGLRAVDDHIGTHLVGAGRNGLDVVHDTQDVGDLRARDDLCLGADLALDLLGRDGVVVIHAQIDEVGARGTADLLPGDEVGVVLHDGDHDLVARFEDGGAQRAGQEVQTLGSVASEDDLVALGLTVIVDGADEARDVLARVGDGLRGLDGEAVEPAQGVGVHRLVEGTLGGEHGLGALRRGGRIEERDVRMLREQGKVLFVGALLDTRNLFGCEHAYASWLWSRSWATSAPRTACARATAAS